jgi:hypothetical protein
MLGAHAPRTTPQCPSRLSVVECPQIWCNGDAGEVGPSGAPGATTQTQCAISQVWRASSCTPVRSWEAANLSQHSHTTGQQGSGGQEYAGQQESTPRRRGRQQCKIITGKHRSATSKAEEDEQLGGDSSNKSVGKRVAPVETAWSRDTKKFHTTGVQGVRPESGGRMLDCERNEAAAEAAAQVAPGSTAAPPAKSRSAKTPQVQ